MINAIDERVVCQPLQYVGPKFRYDESYLQIGSSSFIEISLMKVSANSLLPERPLCRHEKSKIPSGKQCKVRSRMIAGRGEFETL